MQIEVEARRNKLLGLWASGLLGKSEIEQNDYVKEVIKADFQEVGHEDVYRKLADDLGNLASEDEIRNACKFAAADEFIDKLPEKYNTFIGENGVRLSGGQKQRISIARAVLKESPIIPCNLCGTQEGLQRQAVKDMLKDWDKKSPGRKEIIFKSIKNIAPSHMLDKSLYDFENYEIKMDKPIIKVEDMVP